MWLRVGGVEEEEVDREAGLPLMPKSSGFHRGNLNP